MPREKLLEYDFRSMLRGQVGSAGIGADKLRQLSGRLEKARETIRQGFEDESLAYLNVPERKAETRQVKILAKKMTKGVKTLIVIGIGGSDLGAKTLVRALQPSGHKLDVRFVGSSTDPEEIAQLLQSVDLKSCLLNVVSKSGGTIEPMSTFLLLRERLIKKVGRKNHAGQVVATTDPSAGTLHEISRREGYAMLPVPHDVGGRFSILTPVGLFPSACAGIAVDGLLKGAAEMRDSFLATDLKENEVLKFAGLHYLGYALRGQRITVLMPYAARLDLLADWFRQLWAESLGKSQDRAGRESLHGLTPIASLGPADQHSQLQLYSEGPFDKLITLVGVKRMRDDFVLPDPYPDLDGVAYFAGRRSSELLAVERQATAAALTDDRRPNGTLIIPRIEPKPIGSLLTFFMLATSVMGELFDIDAYNQPGVEGSKRHIARLLKRQS